MENRETNNNQEENIRRDDSTVQNDDSVNTGSSKVDTAVHQKRNEYGRTTDVTGVGHEPGTTPGLGA